jgi:hypothetical protein
VTLATTPLYTPLRLVPGPSRLLAIVLLSVHGLALAIVLLLPLPWWGRVGLFLVTAASLYHGLWVHAWRRASAAIAEALWDERGQWHLTLVSGRRHDAQLQGDSFVTQPLTVLNFRTGPLGLRSLVLTGDNMDADLLRRLRVRLNLHAPAAADRLAPR